jgi:hypothetical protein
MPYLTPICFLHHTPNASRGGPPIFSTSHSSPLIPTIQH